METLRRYGYADVRRARNSFAEVRSEYQTRNISLRGGEIKAQHNIQILQERTAGIAEQMWDANREWVNAKFEPRLLFLQQNATVSTQRASPRDLVEEHFRRGLAKTVTLHVKVAGHEIFDPQDTIVAYTENFLRMLKIGEVLKLPQGRVLKLAEGSSRLDAQTLIRILRKFNDRFPQHTIVTEALQLSKNLEGHLQELSDRCISLAVKPEYRKIPLRVIRFALTGKHRFESSEAYLAAYREDVTTADISEGVEQKVIFERSKQKQRKKTFVPIEVRLAGEALQGVRKRYRVDDKTITNITGLAANDIYAFERGELVDINPMHILSAVMKYLDIPAGFGSKNLKEMHNQIETLNWLRVFGQNSKIPKDKRLGRAIKLLRMAEIKANPQNPLAAQLKSFAAKMGLTKSDLAKWETGKKIPDQVSLKNLLDVSVLATLDDDNKAVQYLRLQSSIKTNEYKEGDEEPMTLTRLKTSSFSEIMRYLRRLKGTTHEVVRKKLGVSKRRIGHIENEGKQIRESEFASFVELLGLEENSAIVKILKNKAFGTGDILQENYERVLSEKYLFQEHIDQLDPYFLSTNDEDIFPWIDTMTVGEKIRFLRLRRKMEQSDVAEDAGIGLTTIKDIETGSRNVTGDILVRIAEVFEYDNITNPILLSLFDQNEEERAAA